MTRELDIFSHRNRLPMPETRDEFWARKRHDATDVQSSNVIPILFKKG